MYVNNDIYIAFPCDLLFSNQAEVSGNYIVIWQI